MAKYIVIEMQNGVVGNHAWVYDTREDAEVKEYETLAEVVKSNIPVHTVLLLSDEGFELDRKCYKHDVQPEQPALDGAVEPDEVE